ncbi:MtN3-like protein [Phytophthora cinnamomi]|uniref:MtN3-like protein n=1 Tax=Phytophthora cinnamomi TaxID=4785 RepID=UPI00355AA6D4|nr:MtN3-like protein [Phytophthora cinnamomi]
MFPLFATQVFGQLAATVYNAVYYRWSVPEKRKELRKLYAWAFAMHCALSLYTVLGLLGATCQSYSEVGTYLGYVGIVIDVWMFTSPLGTLKHVMETKSAASIPINLSLMLFVSTSLWVVSGLVDSDYFVAGLNAIGSLLSVVQIVFYMIYRPTGDEGSVQSLENGDTSEVSIVVVTPNAKCEADLLSIQSPVYKMLSSPTSHRAG